jgi:hypothetical protein
LCYFSSWSILLVKTPGRCLTSLIPRGVLYAFAPLPKPERLCFTPDRVTWGSLGGDQSPLLPPKGRLIIWTWVLISLTSCTPLPSLVPVLHQVPMCILHPGFPGGWVSPPDQIVPWCLAGSLLLAVQGMHPSSKGGEKSLSPESWQWAPKKCCRNLKMRYRTLRQFSRKQHVIVLAQTHVQRLSLKNKGVSPYISLQASYRSKKQSLISYMVAYDSIGYFISPVHCDIFHV